MNERSEQNMNTHPYPHKVVEAVARALLKSGETRGGFGAGGDWDATGYVVRSEFMEHANTALTALWEASRVVDTDQIPDDAVYMNDLGGIGFVGSDRDTCEVNRMEHIIYWGDQQ